MSSKRTSQRSKRARDLEKTLAILAATPGLATAPQAGK
jgi:hypothetical protein